MPAALGPQTSCGPGPNEADSAPYPRRSRSEIERSSSFAREPPRALLGRRTDGHHHVDVVIVAHRTEDARRQRPVELEGELVGGDVLEDL